MAIQYQVRVDGSAPLTDELPIRDEEKFREGQSAAAVMFANDPVDADSPEEAARIVFDRMPDAAKVREVWLFSGRDAWVFAHGELRRSGTAEELLKERFGPDYEVPPELANP
jgi:hypothetical protein